MSKEAPPNGTDLGMKRTKQGKISFGADMLPESRGERT